MCVVPTLGPATFEKSTFTSARGVPQLFVRVALTVAVVPTSCDWVPGVRVRAALGHDALPMAVHCVESFVPGGQVALPIAPLRRTCPVSATVEVTTFTAT